MNFSWGVVGYRIRCDVYEVKRLVEWISSLEDSGALTRGGCVRNAPNILTAMGLKPLGTLKGRVSLIRL